jgi:predicted deacylase
MERGFSIGGQSVEPGTRARVDIPLGTLPSLTNLDMHVYVVRGDAEGPTLFLSGAIHGDEINGVEIVRRVLGKVKPNRLSGTLVAVPIVNVYAFIHESRYCPDRRDLNRSFPGSKRGSLASRLAHHFMTEVVELCDYGIDLHTAVRGRYNLPHVRADFSNPELHRLASAFGAPVFFTSNGPRKCVRREATEAGVPVILFEGGEAGRFDHQPISLGVDGVLRVMKELGMIGHAPGATETVEATGTKWVRAKRGGLLRLDRLTGEPVKKRQKLGTIGDALGDESSRVIAPCDGIIISHVTNPLLNQGDAIIHIAKTG